MYYCLVSAFRNRALKYKPNWKTFVYLPFSAQNDDAVFSLFASHTIPRILITDKEGIIRAVYTDDPLADLSRIGKRYRCCPNR